MTIVAPFGSHGFYEDSEECVTICKFRVSAACKMAKFFGYLLSGLRQPNRSKMEPRASGYCSKPPRAQHIQNRNDRQAQNSAFLSLGPSRILVTKGKARQRLIKVNDTQFLNSRVAFTSLF